MQLNTGPGHLEAQCRGPPSALCAGGRAPLCRLGAAPALPFPALWRGGGGVGGRGTTVLRRALPQISSTAHSGSTWTGPVRLLHFAVPLTFRKGAETGCALPRSFPQSPLVTFPRLPSRSLCHPLPPPGCSTRYARGQFPRTRTIVYTAAGRRPPAGNRTPTPWASKHLAQRRARRVGVDSRAVCSGDSRSPSKLEELSF